MATKIFVGGLSYEYTDEQLAALFKTYGEVESAVTIKDRDSGRSKGFGFVEMSSENAQAAITGLNHKDVDGRKLTVNQARPKNDEQ